MKTEAITIKGDKNGINIIVNATFTLLEVVLDLEKKIFQNLNFFEGANIKIISSTIEHLSADSFNNIHLSLSDKLQSKTLTDYIYYLESCPSLPKNEELEPQLIDNEMKTEFFMGNIRSGQHHIYEGHVVVLGDINSGAQVEAKGNICVMGTIRGTVHAGIEGNITAFISCKHFDAPQAQIRIADLIVRANNKHSPKISAGLEIACIEGNNIVVLTKE